MISLIKTIGYVFLNFYSSFKIKAVKNLNKQIINEYSNLKKQESTKTKKITKKYESKKTNSLKITKKLPLTLVLHGVLQNKASSFYFMQKYLRKNI